MSVDRPWCEYGARDNPTQHTVVNVVVFYNHPIVDEAVYKRSFHITANHTIRLGERVVSAAKAVIARLA